MSKEYNPNLYEATTGTFTDKYWKAVKTEIVTLESMGPWEIFDIYENIHFIS